MFFHMNGTLNPLRIMQPDKLQLTFQKRNMPFPLNNALLTGPIAPNNELILKHETLQKHFDTVKRNLLFARKTRHRRCS